MDERCGTPILGSLGSGSSGSRVVKGTSNSRTAPTAFNDLTHSLYHLVLWVIPCTLNGSNAQRRKPA